MPFLADLCSLNNGGCSHNCTVAPGEGIACSCPLGMELGADNKTCQIQSYCAKHLKCSQKCEQDKYNVKCSCYEGWMLEPDGESCRSTGKCTVEPLCICIRPTQDITWNSWNLWVESRSDKLRSQHSSLSPIQSLHTSIPSPVVWTSHSSLASPPYSLLCLCIGFHLGLV